MHVFKQCLALVLESVSVTVQLFSFSSTPAVALPLLSLRSALAPPPAEANYGGRVTDELDRRVLASYLHKFYCEEALSVPGYLLSPLPTYYVPENGPLSSFRDYILTLPAGDRPEAFGQHPNAEISYLIEDSKVRSRDTLHRNGTERNGMGRD